MNFERITNIIGVIITFVGFLSLIGLIYITITEEVVVYDTIIKEKLEVTYFDSSIDTLVVERNEILGYTLENGDLSTSVDYVSDNKHWYSTYLIKCGVRDYKIIK